MQPDRNDLIVATHGRGIWILDDAGALQRFAGAQVQQATLFPLRPAYLFNRHQDTFDLLAPGENPAAGALITIYQRTPASTAPSIEILDPHNAVIKRWTLKNVAGFQRTSWALCAAPPRPWLSAPAWNRSEDCGAFAAPGIYRVRARIGASVHTEPLEVLGAPFFHATRADYQARHDLAARMYAIYDAIDSELNTLDRLRGGTAPGSALRARIDALSLQLSINPQNSQDDDFLEDMLRERVQGFLSSVDGAFTRPTAAQYAEAAAIERQYRDLSRRFAEIKRVFPHV